MPVENFTEIRPSLLAATILAHRQTDRQADSYHYRLSMETYFFLSVKFFTTKFLNFIYLFIYVLFFFFVSKFIFKFLRIAYSISIFLSSLLKRKVQPCDGHN